MIGDRLQDLMASKKITLLQLSNDSGIPMETLRNIYYKKVKDPKVSTVFQLSKSLDVSMEYLLGGEQYLKCNQEEIEIINNYRNCGIHGKGLINLVSKFEMNAAEKERNFLNKHRIPCLIPVGKVVDGIKYNSCNVVEEFTTLHNAYLAIEITSNYFAPAYCKSDRILLENRFPEDGERAVFTDGLYAFFRFYELDGRKYRLKCLNGRGEDIILNRMDEMNCLGTCIGVVRK